MRQEVFPEYSIKYTNMYNIQENLMQDGLRIHKINSVAVWERKIGAVERKQVECLKTQERHTLWDWRDSLITQ